VVIGVWVAIAVALPLSFPSLNEMSEKHPLSILPSDAPSNVTARKMTEAFHESGSEDLLLEIGGKREKRQVIEKKEGKERE